MIRPFARLPLAAGLLLIAFTSGVSAGPSPKNPPDCFLPRPARSVDALVRQVQSDPTVCRRYARFFHVPESRLAGYLRANLVTSRLGRGGVYTVYYVRPSGLVYPAMVTLPNGSAVFALKDGPPVITAGEGEPLIRYRAAVETHVIHSRPAPIVEDLAPTQTIAPAQVNTRVAPTVEQTPVYQPAPEPETPADGPRH